MKTNGKHEVIARIARQSLVLTALLATVLAIAGISSAQSGANSPATPAAKPAVVPAKAPAPHAAKGMNTGVQIHGHWTIEVRNPDGSVATHREFENSLVTGQGDGLLASILGRGAAPGGWRITLRQSASSGNGIIEMDIDEPGGTGAIACALNNGGGSPTGCSTNLSVTPTGGTLTLSGSDAVNQGFPATVGYVETDNYLCVASVSPTACLTAVTAGATQFTAKNLDGIGTDPSPVPVTRGQTVAVTVVFSFSSPSP